MSPKQDISKRQRRRGFFRETSSTTKYNTSKFSLELSTADARSQIEILDGGLNNAIHVAFTFGLNLELIKYYEFYSL